MKTQSLILGTLVTLAPLAGYAQADSFRAIDRNGDGSVSSEEWYLQSVAPVPFTIVDVNGDGRISESEYRDWSSARGGANALGITAADRFRAIDRNQDGVITVQEWKEGMLSLTPFSSVDVRQTGRITRAQFIAWDEQHGGAAGAAPAPSAGIASSPMAERLRSLDQGVAGPAGPIGAEGPPAVRPTQPPIPSSLTPSPPSPVTTVPPTSQIPGVSSPALGSGNSFMTR